jgi:hypothetical protein
MNGPTRPEREEDSYAATPQALDAELSVLAAMLLDKDAIARIVAMLDSQAFYRLSHGLVFEAIKALHARGEPADVVTTHGELKRRGDLEAAGGAEFLAQIMESATTAANVEAHARLVQEAAAKRHLVEHTHRAQERFADPTRDLAETWAEFQRDGEAALGGLRVGTSNRFAEAAVSATDLCAMETPKPRSLLGDGVLTEGGLGIFYGAPGLGKSWLGLSVARALVRGEPWFGLQTPDEGVRVGIIQLELGAHTLKARFRALGVSDHEHDTRLVVLCRPRLKGAVDLYDKTQMHDLRNWIVADKMDVVIVDAFSRAHTASEVKAEELGSVLAGLDELRHGTGCAVVLVHHERKAPAGAEKGDDMDALRGHSRLQSDPTLLVRVKRTAGGMRRLVFAKVTEGPTPADVCFRLREDGTPEVVESPESKRDTNRERVFQAVAGNPAGVSRAEVERMTGLKKSAAAKHLKALVEENRIAVFGPEKDPRYAALSVQPSEASAEGQADGDTSSWDNDLRDSVARAWESF